ncbi:MAG: DUF4347 domain-containing protein, partial [Planctomycetaceae bacterium]|nr:DUF4347 domain-containing protein [Planctomycetaceae bacterium]
MLSSQKRVWRSFLNRLRTSPPRHRRRRPGNSKRTEDALEQRALLSATEVVFVDSSVWAADSIPEELSGNEVVVLNSDADGVQQMADYLAGRSGIDAIHVISHGDIGHVGALGSSALDQFTIGTYQSQLSEIGASLTENGDILLWGCGVAGNEGVDFVSAVAAATGADVAASDDLTASPSLGGDWDLEFTTGPIEASNILAAFNPQIQLESDTISGASTLSYTAGTVRSQSGSIGNSSLGANDVDIWRVYLRTGEQISIDVTTPSSSLDPYLRVFNSSGSQLAANDDGGAGLDSHLTYNATFTGYHYLGVSSYANYSYNPNVAGSGSNGHSTGTFTLSFLVTPTIRIADASVSEGGTAYFGVYLSQPSSRTVTANYQAISGSASTADYSTFGSRSVTIPAGSTSASAYVVTWEDTIYEPTESFTVNITSASNAIITDRSATGIIYNDDPTPNVYVADTSVTEGGVAAFRISLDRPSAYSTRVYYSTANGSATSPQDYTATSGSVLLSPGQTSAFVSVQTTNDNWDEPNESFSLQLTNVSGPAVIVDSVGVGIIIDNDLTPSLRITDVTVVEGGTAVFSVVLSNPSYTTISANYTTSNGSALTGSDFAGQSGTLRFLPGETVHTFSVTTNDDNIDEPNETFLGRVTSVSGPVGVADAVGVATIIDNDPTPLLRISDVTV